MFLWLLKLRRQAQAKVRRQAQAKVRRLARSRMRARALPSLSLSELLLILVLMWAPAWLPVL